MKKAVIIFLTSIALNSLSVTNLFAKAESGFGLFGGAASHEFEDKNLDGSTTKFESSGLSLGIDYQFAISDHFSISPFLVGSGEDVDDCSICTARQGIFGAQLRYWLGGFFLGGHIGSYSQVREVQILGIAISATGRGGGAGVIVGFESEGGFFFSVQRDKATINIGAIESDLTGTRLHFGFRWK